MFQSLPCNNNGRRNKKALPRSKASEENDPAARVTPAGVISPKAVWGDPIPVHMP
jgi:hypothetical protein